VFDHSVKIHAMSVWGEGRVPYQELPSLLFSNHMEIDGYDVLTDGSVTMYIGPHDGFIELEMFEPTEEWIEQHKKNCEENGLFYEEPTGPRYFNPDTHKFTPLRTWLTADDFLDGTDETKIRLAVRSFEMVESLKEYPERRAEIRRLAREAEDEA